MSSSHVLAALAALGLWGTVFAQDRPSQPNPATSPARGAAADRADAGGGPAADPAATALAEGAAAERTPPAQTQTRSKQGARSLIGASVVTRTNTPLGEVTDVVFDAKRQPDFVIISTQKESTAVPYAAAAAMMSGGKVVIDQARLDAAPKVQQGEWRDPSSDEWRSEARRYWERG